MSYIILTIIPIIISIPAFLVSIKSLKECNNIKCKCKECTKKENNNKYNIDELIYSVEFNTAIDDKICPLLNKYPNNVIVAEVTGLICKEWSISAEDISKVNSHIRDILLNYNNSYMGIDTKTIEQDIEKYDDISRVNTIETRILEKPDNITTTPNNKIDIRNIFSDFYKD